MGMAAVELVLTGLEGRQQVSGRRASMNEETSGSGGPFVMLHATAALRRRMRKKMMRFFLR